MIKSFVPVYDYLIFIPEVESDSVAFHKLQQLLYKGVQQEASNGLIFSLPFSKEEQSKEMLEMELLLNEINTSFADTAENCCKRIQALSEGVFSFLYENRQLEEDIWLSFYANILGSISAQQLTKAFLVLEIYPNTSADPPSEKLRPNEIGLYYKWLQQL